METLVFSLLFVLSAGFLACLGLLALSALCGVASAVRPQPITVAIPQRRRAA